MICSKCGSPHTTFSCKWYVGRQKSSETTPYYSGTYSGTRTISTYSILEENTDYYCKKCANKYWLPRFLLTAVTPFLITYLCWHILVFNISLNPVVFYMVCALYFVGFIVLFKNMCSLNIFSTASSNGFKVLLLIRFFPGSLIFAVYLFTGGNLRLATALLSAFLFIDLIVMLVFVNKKIILGDHAIWLNRERLSSYSTWNSCQFEDLKH